MAGLEEGQRAGCGDLMLHNELSEFCLRIQNCLQYLFEAKYAEARDFVNKQEMGLATRFASLVSVRKRDVLYLRPVI